MWHRPVDRQRPVGWPVEVRGGPATRTSTYLPADGSDGGPHGSHGELRSELRMQRDLWKPKRSKRHRKPRDMARDMARDMLGHVTWMPWCHDARCWMLSIFLECLLRKCWHFEHLWTSSWWPLVASVLGWSLGWMAAAGFACFVGGGANLRNERGHLWHRAYEIFMKLLKRYS